MSGHPSSMTEEMVKISDIAEKCVAIVRFGPSGFSTDGFRPGEYFQVTIDPEKLSPSREFIRFGFNEGDEILGWQRCDAMCVIEVLDDLDDSPVAAGHGVTEVA